MIDYIKESGAPAPAGHYSQATLAGNMLFISGQLPVDPHAVAGGTPSKVPFGEQARRAMSNMLAILKGAGGSEASLVKVTAYIVGVCNWPAFNEVYGDLLGSARPARSVVPVPELHFGYLVEVDAIAFIPSG